MPISWQERSRYVRKVNSWIKQSKSLDSATRKALQAEAEIVRKTITDAARELKKVTALTSAEVDMLKGVIADALKTYETNAVIIMEKGVGQTLEMGFSSVVDGITDLEILPTGIINFNPEMTSVAMDYSADLIRGINEETLRRINTELRLAQLGQLSPFDTMKKVDIALGTGSTSGVSAKAERIVRTELTRSFGIGQKLGMDGLADVLDDDIPKPKKMWISAKQGGRTRQEHWDADGQVVDYDKPFIVGGEELMYPGDPAGSAWNTINCLCRMVPVVDEVIDAEVEKTQGV